MLQAGMDIDRRQRRRSHWRQVPHRSVAADVSRLILPPWPASKRKGKEAIQLKPDATRGLGHRQAPAPKKPLAASPHRSVAADVSRLILPPWPASKRKGKEAIRLTP